MDGQARKFVTNWTGSGGERYSVSMGPGVIDSTSTNVVYSVSFYITDTTHVNQLEFDVNQVIAGGNTVIFGTQCNFPEGFWDYTTNVASSAHWNQSNIPCTKANWTVNTWHTLSIASHRSGGTVTYDSVTFDGTTTNFSSASGNSSFALGWSPVGLFVLNYQLNGDAVSTGTTNYLDQMSLSHSQ